MRNFVLAISSLAILVPNIALAGDYAPIVCGKAKSVAEKTICKSYDLGQQDARMATLYGLATSLVAMGRRGDIQDKQRAWLSARDACGKKIGCLKREYENRIKSLDDVVQTVVSRGPF